jgi:hypothetical protein
MGVHLAERRGHLTEQAWVPEGRRRSGGARECAATLLDLANIPVL